MVNSLAVSLIFQNKVHYWSRGPYCLDNLRSFLKEVSRKLVTEVGCVGGLARCLNQCLFVVDGVGGWTGRRTVGARNL